MKDFIALVLSRQIETPFASKDAVYTQEVTAKVYIQIIGRHSKMLLGPHNDFLTVIELLIKHRHAHRVFWVCLGIP